MKFDKKSSDDNYFETDDTTKYGEFISSYFSWIPLSKQKQRAKELDNMTKNKKNNNV